MTQLDIFAVHARKERECPSCGCAGRHEPLCPAHADLEPGKTEESPVLDQAESRRRRDEGMRRAASAVDDGWRAHAHQLLEQLARTRRELTADDLWAAGLQAPPSGSANALGAIFTSAARAGLIVDSGRAVKSSRPSSHARRIPVWSSYAYRGAA